MKIHDSGYKKLFSNKTIFRELMKTFVDEKWVDEIDFDESETVDKSFISDHYKNTECDIIYRVRLHNKTAFVYVLLEFQSTVNHFMASRVLNYITNFYMDYLQTNRNLKKLPCIFPIVLYNGDKPWTAPVHISKLIDSSIDFGRFALNFEYFKIAENEYSKESLLKIRNIVPTLFLAETRYDKELLEQELLCLFNDETDCEAVSLLLNWFRQLSIHGRIDAEDSKLLEEIYYTKEEAESMLITALKKEKKATYQKGKLEGRLEGKVEGKLETAKSMLQQFPVKRNSFNRSQLQILCHL